MADKTFVCRCEDVTRHEVEEAVALGHRDLESVKRYTGLGTGLCQGKQCVALASRLVTELSGERVQQPITPRPLLHPTRLADLARLLDGDGEEEAP
ncbi:MAG: (2Fe-2S)-binding protein [Sandaracinus sp.]